MRRWRIFFSHWENWLGLILVLAFLSGAIFAPIISPPDQKNPGPFKQVGRTSDFVPHPPTEKAILGTLPGQYDVFHTLVWGMRDGIQFGLLVAIGSFAVGVFFGSVSGYAGGLLNSLMMRIADAFLTFPPLAGVVFLQQLSRCSEFLSYCVGLGLSLMGKETQSGGTFQTDIPCLQLVT
jgi:peptide/nickel transport system permease protein